MIDEKKLIKDLKEYTRHLRFRHKPDALTVIRGFMHIIHGQPKTGEWIPCSERLPENAKHKGAFCPKYQVMTKYGVTEGWYNPDYESWYILVWFLTAPFKEHNIDMERGDIPKRLRVPAGIVIAWRPLPEPWEGVRDVI